MAEANNGALLPALPDPETLALAKVEEFALQCRDWRAAILDAEDSDAGLELWRLTAAAERYIADAKARRAMQAESRRTEIMLGKLLGPAEIGANQHNGGSNSFRGDLHDPEIAACRFLMQHEPIAEELIGRAITRRAPLLKQIRERLAKKPPPGTASVALADWQRWLPQQAPCDLLLTDPPYMTDVEDVAAFAAEWLPSALELVKPTGRAYVFIGAYPEELHAYMTARMPTQVLAWSYRNTIGPSSPTRYSLNWQAVLYYCGAEAPELHSESLSDRFAAQQINAPDGRFGEGRYHAWEKPLELARRIVALGSAEGDTVLDPFAGTGTHLLAAAELGRIGLGCDCDAAMVDIAVARGVDRAV